MRWGSHEYATHHVVLTKTSVLPKFWTKKCRMACITHALIAYHELLIDGTGGKNEALTFGIPPPTCYYKKNIDAYRKFS